MRKSLLFLSVLMCFSVLTGCGASEAEQAAMDKMSADYSDTFSYEKREGDGFLVKSEQKAGKEPGCGMHLGSCFLKRLQLPSNLSCP